MKISVVISKTFQEDPYEPIRIEVGLDQDLSDNTTKNELRKEYKRLANVLQDSIEEIYLERVKERRDVDD